MLGRFSRGSADTTSSVPSDGTPSAGLEVRTAWRLVRRRKKAQLFTLGVLIILISFFAGVLAGRALVHRDLAAREDTIQQLRSERQQLGGELNRRNDELTTLQAKLNKVQAALDAILPSENTYNITPNQALILAGGRVTVGLVGSPSNERVTLNVNGQSHFTTAGDNVTVSLNGGGTCQIRVQSFDMFKAVLTTACSESSR